MCFFDHTKAFDRKHDEITTQLAVEDREIFRYVYVKYVEGYPGNKEGGHSMSILR